jgi:hypothetical protein
MKTREANPGPRTGANGWRSMQTVSGRSEMKIIRLLTASAFLLTTSGCITIGSLSYTTPEGRTLTVGFQQQVQPHAPRDGKAVILPERRGLAK